MTKPKKLNFKEIFTSALAALKRGDAFQVLGIQGDELHYLRVWASRKGYFVEKDGKHDAIVYPKQPVKKYAAIKDFLESGMKQIDFENVNINTVRSYVFNWNQRHDTKWKTIATGPRSVCLFKGPTLSKTKPSIIDDKNLI